MQDRFDSLLLATGNQGKVRELKELFRRVPLTIKDLRDFEGVSDVDETGSTFEENSRLKASGFAVQTRQYSLADDSGLEVEALGNAPGVYSARFAGAEAGYDVKISKLLSLLNETGDEDRRARFVCVMSLADPDGRIVHSTRGECSGKIAEAARGEHGFGYDPIFIPDGFAQTFGELGDDIKKTISHRARATELIIRYLLDFIAVRT